MMRNTSLQNIKRIASGFIGAAFLVASSFAMTSQVSANADPGQEESSSDSGDMSFVLLAQDKGSGSKMGTRSIDTDNLSFTCPTSINYVVSADGTLTGPDKSVTYIQNSSSFAIYTSSVLVSPESPWQFISNIANAGTSFNKVELVFGPDAKEAERSYSLNAALFTNKTEGEDNIPSELSSAWSMNASGKVGIDSVGKVANINTDISSTKAFGTVQWYMSPCDVPVTSNSTSHGSYVLSGSTGTQSHYIESESIEDDPSITNSFTPGTTAQIAPTPASGYQVDAVTVLDGNGNPVSVVENNGVYSFTVPYNGATVSVSFKENTVLITKATTSHGSFVVSNSSNAQSDILLLNPGSTAYIIPTGDSCYNVNTVSVTDGANAVSVSNSNGVYRFTVPSGGATVSVSFAPRALSTFTMSELKSISANIRSNGTSSQYYSAFAELAASGASAPVKLHDKSSSNAMLVDVHAGYGLVFMLDNIKYSYRMNSGSDTASFGWERSAMRKSIRSGGSIYNTYLDGITMTLADSSAQTVVPATVTTYTSWSGGGSPRQQTLTDETFFLASATEVYSGTGSAAVNTKGTNYEPNGHQFIYFANLGVTGSNYAALHYNSGNGWTKAGGNQWWLRSNCSDTGFWGLDCYYYSVKSNGGPSAYSSDTYLYILPCFCL